MKQWTWREYSDRAAKRGRLAGFALAVLLLLAAASAAPAQIVGTRLRGPNITGLSGSPAKSLDEYAGRLVLLEFFAYW